jgi:hypothetical protein
LGKRRADLRSSLNDYFAELLGINAYEAELISEAQDLGIDLADTGSAAGGGGSTSSADTSILDAQLAQANANLQTATNAAAYGDAFIRAAFSPGDLGSGGATAIQAGGGQVNVNIQSFHPTDPTTLQQLAQTISSAIGHQGGALSPLVNVGV